MYVKTAPGQKRSRTPRPMNQWFTSSSLYGLAQSPVLWYDTINAVMLSVGFTPTKSDSCVDAYGSGNTFVILTLCVDDILITGADENVVERLKKAINGPLCDDRHG